MADFGEVASLEMDSTAGETKVTPTGHLSGGGKYSLKTFTVIGHGEQLFMLAAEVAQHTGYRDSYLLFLRNRKLQKVITTRTERDDLVRRQIIPFSYRYRHISLVTARSVFIQFGQRILDDYDGNKAIVRQKPLLQNSEVQPKAGLAMRKQRHRNPGMSLFRNRVVEGHVNTTLRWNTVFPYPTASQRFIDKSIPCDQTVRQPSNFESALHNGGDYLRKSPLLPSIWDLFGDLRDLCA